MFFHVLMTSIQIHNVVRECFPFTKLLPIFSGSDEHDRLRQLDYEKRVSKVMTSL